MPPAVPTEETFSIPPPPWLVRVGLPVLALVPAMVLVGYPWLFAENTSGLQVIGMVLLVVVVALLTKKYGTILTIGSYGVTLEEPSWTQSVLYSDVKQLREYHPDNSPAYLQLEPLVPTGSTMRISATFPDYPRIRELLTTYVPDFSAQPLPPDHSLSPAPAAAPKKAPKQVLPSLPPVSRPIRRWARTLNLAAFGAVGWLMVGRPYEAAMALGLAVPLLAAVVLWRSRGALQLTTSKPDRRPDVALALWGPLVFVVGRHWLFMHLLDWQPLWGLAGVVAVGFGLLLLLGIRQPSGARSSWHTLQALGLAAGFGLGTALFYNCAAGGQGQVRYTAQVHDKYVHTGKSTTYYLIVTTWGPAGAPTDFSVSRDRYERQQVGDTLTLWLHRGRLGASWAELANLGGS